MHNIPENYVEIEVEIDDNGNFKRTIIGHGPNTSCNMEKDDELMNDLLAELGGSDDNDLTDEYYSEKQNPITARPISVENPKTPSENKKNKITLGFGT